MIEISHPEAIQRQPLVSVLMLAYRHEPYIAEAIEGVLAQKCDFPVELIIAEDCSPDRTLAIAEEYLTRHPSVIRIVTGEYNIGVMPNFYRALQACRGKYIALCEGDDYWCHPEKLSKQIKILDSNEFIGMVHGNFVNCQMKEGSWSVSNAGVHNFRKISDLSGDIFGILQNELVVRTCTACYRRSVLEAFCKTKLANPEFLAGDIQLAVFCAAYWQIGYVPDIVSVYRITPNSATRGSFSGKVDFAKSLISIHETIKNMFGYRSEYGVGAYADACHLLIRAAFRASDQNSFWDGVEALRRLNPQAAQSGSILAMRFILRFPLLARAVNSWLNAK